MRRSARRTIVLASLLFFVSGALGLGYEWIWIRKATLMVGASQIAMSTVLTAFFLGIATGSYAVGRYFGGRRWSPLAIYGVFEILIGLFALGFPLLFALLGKGYGAWYPWFAGSDAGLLALRFSLLFVLFLVPTFLMGGTLPLLLDGLIHADRSVGPRTAVLYGLNILGAVIGVLVTSYLAVPLLGLNASSVVAGLANLTIGIVAVVAFGRDAPPTAQEEHPALGRFFPVASFASGLIALGYQICWARYFSLVHFSSVQSTAMLLAVYLLALAVGSFLLGPLLSRRWDPLRIFATVQAAIPVTVWVFLSAWRQADYRFAVLREWTETGGAVPAVTLETAHDYPRFWHFVGETPDAVFFAPLFQISLTIFVPVMLMGAGLPALIATAVRHSAAVKSVSGRLLFFNTLGASVGSFIAGYALIPALGLHRGLLVLGLASAVLAFACVRRLPGGVLVRYVVPGVSVAGLLTLGLATKDVTSETIRLRQIGRDSERARILKIIEGPLTTAYLIEDASTLRVGSGAVQMGNVSRGAVGLQVVEGHLPVVLYPGSAPPRDCLGICLGSGQSFGALLRHPIRQLDVVEISGEISRLARGPLAAHNHSLASDARVRFHLEDGRHFVARGPANAYDIVSMESPPPIAEGAHSLYTTEFYRDVRRVLRPGGVFMQFMPLYYLTPMDTRSILRTLAQEFPYVFVARVSPGDFMLLAYPERPRFSMAAIRVRVEAFSGEWGSRGLAPAAWFTDSKHPIASTVGVLSMLVTGPDDVRRIPVAPILRDDRPLLSYSTGDRWLARRYMGPTLASLSLAAIPITPYASMAGFFDPAIDPETTELLTDERAGILRGQGIPHPREVERRELALELAVDPGDRIRRALDLAVTYDAALRKEDALRSLDAALGALAAAPDRFREEWVAPARGVVRNRLAVYEDGVGRWMEIWSARYPASPLLVPLVAEWEAYREREAAGRRAYLFQ